MQPSVQTTIKGPTSAAYVIEKQEFALYIVCTKNNMMGLKYKLQLIQQNLAV